MIAPKHNLTDQRFERLTAIEYVGKMYWRCRCDCGNEKKVRQDCLRGGIIRSCGCLLKETRPFNNRKHGMFGSKIYGSWGSMVQRCSDKRHPYYPNYGGRGITVCEKWLQFEGFYEDMKAGHEDHLMLDRIENNHGYYKENCRWITRKEQANNMRSNKFCFVDGEKMTIAQAAEKLNVKYPTLRKRVAKGELHYASGAVS